MSACLWSRLASRILVVVGRVNAGDANLLYEGVRRIAWEGVIVPGASMSVQAHGMNDELRNTRFTALKVKDAVCDRLREMRRTSRRRRRSCRRFGGCARAGGARHDLARPVGRIVVPPFYLTPDDAPTPRCRARSRPDFWRWQVGAPAEAAASAGRSGVRRRLPGGGGGICRVRPGSRRYARALGFLRLGAFGS
ncbi:MAG: THUMP domain-containing protein [Eggerthella lenta]